MEKLRQRILYRYPGVNISYFNDVMNKCSDTNKLSELLNKMREDLDRFIIIEHLNTNTFRELARKLLGDDKRINKIMNSYLLSCEVVLSQYQGMAMTNWNLY